MFSRKLIENLQDGNHEKLWRMLKRGVDNQTQVNSCRTKINHLCTESDISIWRDHFSQIGITAIIKLRCLI